jgi:uncharacterized protein
MTEVRGGASAEDVVAFLQMHPRFLGDYPELAQSLLVPREEGGTTSLASYQLEVLRDKNRELTRRLHELFANAEENERLTVRTHQLSLALMRADSLEATLQTMIACLREDFRGEQVRIVLHREVPGLAGADWLLTVPADDRALAPFEAFLDAGEPLCGRLQKEKLDLLFGSNAAQVESTALLALGGRGMLAIGSSDDRHFFPGMGTLFLRLIGEALETALARHDPG